MAPVGSVALTVSHVVGVCSAVSTDNFGSGTWKSSNDRTRVGWSLGSRNRINDSCVEGHTVNNGNS